MPCKTMVMGDGSMVVLCSRGGGERCCICGKPSSKLCDFKLTGAKAGKTCDKKLCARCAHKVADGVDYCPVHWRMSQKVDNG